MCNTTREELAKSQEIMKTYFDRSARDRKLVPGDRALLLLPTENNKLQMKWKGPFSVKRKAGQNTYYLDINGTERLFHINMLKKYNERTENQVTAAALLFDNDDDDTQGIGIESLEPKKVETYRDVHIDPKLSEEQKQELSNLIAKYQNIFSSVPGCTELIQHNIKLTDMTPIRSKPYPIPYHMYPDLKQEIDEMLKLDVIEITDSPYCSPIIMLKKKDNSYRTVADMRKINKVTLFDCEVIPDPKVIFAKVTESNYFSKVDCCKGFWQIPMNPEHKKYTAFSTPYGNFQFKRMPFGLINAGATYNTMMRKLLKNMDRVDSFVDDIPTYSKTWQKHLDRTQSRKRFNCYPRRKGEENQRCTHPYHKARVEELHGTS